MPASDGFDDARATPSLGGGGWRYVPMATGAVSRSRVRVVDLAHPQYRGRRVGFHGVVGEFVGIARTMAMGIDDSAGVDGGSQQLCLRDDYGREHYLDFEVEEMVTLDVAPDSRLLARMAAQLWWGR